MPPRADTILTDTAIRKLRPTERRYEVWDAARPGFGAARSASASCDSPSPSRTARRARLAPSSPAVAVILLLIASVAMAQGAPAGAAATGDQAGHQETAPQGRAASAAQDAPAASRHRASG